MDLHPRSSSSSTNPRSKRSGYALIAVLGIAAIIRVGIFWGTFDPGQADTDAYRQIAENLANHGVYGRRFLVRGEVQVLPTAYRPPLYPLMLRPLVWRGELQMMAAGGLNLLMGLATIWLVAIWASKQNMGWFGILAILLVACDPILLNQSSIIMTETLATLLAMIVMVVLQRLSTKSGFGWWGLVGVTIGVAILCRPIFLVWAALIIAWVGWQVLSKTRSATTLVAVVGALVLVVGPWIVRNQIQFGKPIFATTHGGYTLLLGNNRSFYQHLDKAPRGQIWRAENRDFQQEMIAAQIVGGQPGAIYPLPDEVATDGRCYELAWATIRDQPGRFVQSCLMRMGRLWSPLPHRLSADESKQRRMLRYGVAIWYGVLFLCSIVGVWCLRGQWLQSPWVWGLFLAGSLTLVHTFYWSNMRMRAPVMPVVCLLAAEGLRCCLNRRLSKSTR